VQINAEPNLFELCWVQPNLWNVECWIIASRWRIYQLWIITKTQFI